MSSQLSTVASQGQRTGSRRRNTLFWVGAEWIYRAFSFLSALDQPLFMSATPCQDGSDSVEPAGFCSGPDPSYRDRTEEESVQGTEAMCLTPYKKSWRHLEPRPGLFLLCLACGPEPPSPRLLPWNIETWNRRELYPPAGEKWDPAIRAYITGALGAALASLPGFRSPFSIVTLNGMGTCPPLFSFCFGLGFPG